MCTVVVVSGPAKHAPLATDIGVVTAAGGSNSGAEVAGPVVVAMVLV